MKINETENAVFDDAGTLHIDGASYLPDSDYEWFFSIDKDDLPKLYAELSKDEVNDEDLPDRFIKILIERKVNAGRLKDICEFKKIKHGFSCWW